MGDSSKTSRRTSQDCIGVRSTQETSKEFQEKIDGKVRVAHLMLDRFFEPLKFENIAIPYPLLPQELASQDFIMVEGNSVFQERRAR